MAQFIPSLHLDTKPKDKLTSEWCMRAVNQYWFNSDKKSLLDGKDVDEIEQFSSGKIKMTPFKKMFKSLEKQLREKRDQNPNMEIVDTTGLTWEPLPLIPNKLNSAVSIVQKIPVEISCKALDPLAAEKKKKDLVFLTAKPKFEEDMQDLANEMNIGEVNLGSTKYSDVPYDNAPYGIDLNDPDELDVFVNILYALGVESAFETVLQQMYELLNAQQVRLLETRDQYKFGVSCNRCPINGMTGLPDIEYVYPDNIYTAPSSLPNYSDNLYRFIPLAVNPMELFNFFPEEICDQEQLDIILNEKGNGYCSCNNINPIGKQNWGSQKVNLVYCEVKSVDYIGIGGKPNSGFKYVMSDVNDRNAEHCEGRLWGQNTYCFWWLQNTQYIFGIDRLPYAHREKGKEAYQTFSTNIYKSQEKSAVELSIPENKRAQRAAIKLEHEVMMALPDGQYIDLKFLRGAVAGLKDLGSKYGIDDVLNMALENNKVIGDSQAFDDTPNLAAQLKPIMKIPGGISESTANGYLLIIQDANSKISQFTGINEQLTGESPTSEGLVGLQKLLINSSLNSLYYVNEAIREQYQRVATIWSNGVKQAVEAGGKRKQAIVDMVGKRKASLIDAVDDIPLHDITAVVRVNQREEERQKFETNVGVLKQGGVLTVADEYMLSNISNPKDQMALVAIKEKRFRKRQEQAQKEAYQQQSNLVQQQGANQQQAMAAKTDGKIKEIYAKGDVDTKITQLAASLGLNAEQFKTIARQAMQDRRAQNQIDKAIKTTQAKADAEQQSALVSNVSNAV